MRNGSFLFREDLLNFQQPKACECNSAATDIVPLGWFKSLGFKCLHPIIFYSNNKRIIIILLCSLFFINNLQSQTVEGITVRATVVDGDTIAYMSLPIVRVYAPKVFKSKKQEKQWNKLIRNVKKVYPYAVIAAEKMREYEAVIISVKSEKEQKRLMKIAEEELKKEFEKDIRDMTFSQGKILIKLIDRETGATSYAIIREFRGTLSAFFWQSVAKLFGANLKDEYDPTGEDKMIEEIVIMIERGDL